MACMKNEFNTFNSLFIALKDEKITPTEIESRLNMFCQRLFLGFNHYDERLKQIFDNYDIKQLQDIHTIFGLAFKTLDFNYKDWDKDFENVYDKSIYPSYSVKKRKKNLTDLFNSLSVSQVAGDQVNKDDLKITFDDEENNSSGPGPSSSQIKCDYVFKKGANINKTCNVTTDGSAKCKRHS